MTIDRRDVLIGVAAGVLWSGARAGTTVVTGQLPWSPDAGAPPVPVRPGPWQFFTADEARSVEALVDRLIPVDAQTCGGKDAGCAVYIDRQLAGPYGRAEGLYRQRPFVQGSKQQGEQSELTPADRCRQGLTALGRYCASAYTGRSFARLGAEEQDTLLAGLETGAVTFDGVDARTFFEQLLRMTQEGFFADPIYGGNRDMCSWRMIGFPGARYDYRDWVERHNERYPLPPVSIGGRPEWSRS